MYGFKNYGAKLSYMRFFNSCFKKETSAEYVILRFSGLLSTVVIFEVIDEHDCKTELHGFIS